MVHVTDFDFKEEYAEEVLHQWMKTGWPKPLKRMRIVHEKYNQSIEEVYYWILDNLKEEMEYTNFIKISDIFAASEHSAFFGVAQQRLGLQQDKIGQFLATIGKMVKELFQLVRELRILDERLELYQKSYEGDEPAEVSLKGYWIDLVEGGAKNPASVYGMSRELGFTTLPDLFFAAPPMPSSKVQGYINSLKFNRKVKEVLARKLKTFIIWKEHTFKELKSRKAFTLKFLRQHYDVIKMYMTWIKPYLRNVKRLSMDEKKMDTPHLISAFEGSMIETEFIATKPFAGGLCYSVMDLHFDYRSRPEMKFIQEGYQRGPVHVGRVMITFRAYAWTAKELENYKRFRDQEDFDLLGSIDSSVQAAYTALGEELEKYLEEAGEKPGSEWEKQEQQKPKQTIFEPFVSALQGAGELLGAFKPAQKGQQAKCAVCGAKNSPKDRRCKNCGWFIGKPSRKEALELDDNLKKAEGDAQKQLYSIVKRVKAAHGWIY
ncbi:MAG: zinc ribbon domain-containing protein [Candidatus Woesearchaeota archaeon]